METDTAFVRANGVVVLYAVTHVGAYVAFIVGPSDAELVDAVGDAKAFNQVYFVEFGVFVVLFFDGTQYLFYCLMIFRLVRESSLEVL
jgi:hypothetical protein